MALLNYDEAKLNTKKKLENSMNFNKFLKFYIYFKKTKKKFVFIHSKYVFKKYNRKLFFCSFYI